MKGKIVLKLVGFSAAVIWVFLFLGVAVLMLEPTKDLILFWSGGLSPYNMDISEMKPWVGTVYVIWYFFSAIVIATLVALWGFRLIGVWKKEASDEETKSED